jgi:NADH-quinone oxidoreductase E subunit
MNDKEHIPVEGIAEDFNYRLWRYEGGKGDLIPLLQAAQEQYGYIPRHAISSIAVATHIPEATVYGVITFYNQFRLKPRGKNLIRLCDGTACHVAGSRMLMDTIEDELGIAVGDTTDDGMFTLCTVACLGCCSLAPVMMVNDRTYGRLTPASLRKVIRSLRSGAA